jgi:transposase InsO family protein
MPWKVSGVVDERARFVLAYNSGEYSMAELCREHGIARKTGYKWVVRHEAGGLAALEDLRRAPHCHPNQTPRALEEQLLALRQAHMRWGPRKLRQVLVDKHPHQVWPAASTICELLKREGLVIPRRKRRRTPAYSQPFAAVDGPNRVWCADFKGWFRTQDGERIDPLTMTDAHSRYLLRCQAVQKTDTARVQAIFEAAFREYGMPEAIRTDNGAPFASLAIAGLSRLAVWLMKLDIVPERIQAGHPEQNGRHERMHRTLKEETAMPPAANRRAQQRAFDRFRQEYNAERPHEALGQRTPAAVYTPSLREFPERVREPEYDSDMQVRKVRDRGDISWKGHRHVFLSETLIGEHVALQQLDERYWCVYFAAFPIALFDSAELSTEPLPVMKDQDMGGWKSGNPKTGDSQISTAPATAAMQANEAENKKQNPSAKVLPMCPV